MAVDRTHLGRRYSCFSCACKFYDLNRPDPLCPNCGANQLDDPSPDPRVAAMAASRKARKAAAAAEAASKKPAKPKPIEESFEDIDSEEGDSLDSDLDEDLSGDAPEPEA